MGSSCLLHSFAVLLPSLPVRVCPVSRPMQQQSGLAAAKGPFFSRYGYPNLMWKVSFSCDLLSRCHHTTVAHEILVVGGARSLDDFLRSTIPMCETYIKKMVFIDVFKSYLSL